MKIVIYCSSFAPAIGGMEKLNETLAAEFTAMGHEVHVITETPGSLPLPYPVTRGPSFGKFLAIARWADVILSAPLSLKRYLPIALARRPVFFSMPDRLGGAGLQRITALLKRFLAGRHGVIVPSRYMATHFANARVITNPYDDKVFRLPDTSEPRHGFVFVGRFVEWKGVQILIEAFTNVADQLPGHDLTLIGAGPEEPRLRLLSQSLGIGDRVHFAGVEKGTALAESIGRHAVMVVPSIGAEPFGIVALEGLACGCRLVVSQVGGLPEAVGPHAVLAEGGDMASLAGGLVEAIRLGPPKCSEIEEYLTGFAPRRVAGSYLAAFAAG